MAESAMILSDEDWAVLADVCSFYLMGCDDVSDAAKALCDRIIEATD